LNDINYGNIAMLDNLQSSKIDHSKLPQFSTIKVAEIVPTVEKIITDNTAAINQLLAESNTYTWENLILPLEESEDVFHRFWSRISHCHHVVDTPELRESYNACLPLISEYGTWISQNETLYNAVNAVATSEQYQYFTLAQKKSIDNALRDFRLAGVHLPADKKVQLAELNAKLSLLTSQYEQNLLDATMAWTRHITDEKQLSGLPESALMAAKAAAIEHDLAGWLLNLEMPCYIAVMTYADSPELRQEVYTAYVTRASDQAQGENAAKWDNTAVMAAILLTRHQQAQLLGFPNYPSYSLTPKMAKTPETVLNFLTDLSTASVSKARQEFQELAEFAQQNYQHPQLASWDLAYYSEKLQKQRYDISAEELRPYFPVDRALSGLFAVVQKLYGIKITLVPNVDTWHPDVRCYAIYDESNSLRALFYVDLYARKNKRGGAWMDECQGRRVLSDGSIQLPIALLTCNLNAPVDNRPALFTHDEVITLFHEFGHGLHHMLTQIDVPEVAGINGVPWDAVELPSQFMENWCWEKEGLDLIAQHYQSHQPLPDDLYDKLIAAKNFQSAMQMVRQLEFSLFDFRMHLEFDPSQKNQIQKILDEVRSQVAVIQAPKFNRFQHGFSHIFAGGYSAGYYSYKWAEVLSADAFSKFEEDGIFNPTTGRQFLHTILEQGGSKDPMELFIAFRGRKPNTEALLRHNGIIS
jgi:oligopeptidase A